MFYRIYYFQYLKYYELNRFIISCIYHDPLLILTSISSFSSEIQKTLKSNSSVLYKTYWIMDFHMKYDQYFISLPMIVVH